MNIPERATKEQIDTMTDTEGNIRVSSVPGSGKTFVLTYRIAYLITEMFVEPSSIVALTFTNKAAAQMKHRLRDIVGDMDADLGGPDEEKSEDRIENAGIVAEDKGIYMTDRDRKR